MQTFPYSIYLNKKALRSRLMFYIIIIIGSIWCFWYGSGHLFTLDYYYPKMVIIMPICIIGVLVGIISESKRLKNNDALVTLTNTGIEFFDKQYTGIGIVPWSDVTGCNETIIANDKYLTISVKDSTIYIDKIKDARAQKKALKFKQKNKNNNLFIIQMVTMDCDIIEFKKTIFQMIEKTQNA